MENDDTKPESKTPEEDLDLGPEPNPQVTRPQPAKPKKERNKKLILAWVVAVLMTIAAAAFAWLYFTSETETPAQTEETTAETTEADTENDTDETSTSQTVYEAEVGKFTLELDPSYVVIERLDGPFEGGPATILDIGESSEDSPGVVTTNPAQAFTIFGRPEESATLASNSRVAALEANELAERQDDGEFAGQTTRVYQVDGLFSVRHIVWVANGSVYEITHISEDETHASMLRVVEAGISFTE